jgi:predicted nucleic acid-binding protein
MGSQTERHPPDSVIFDSDVLVWFSRCDADAVALVNSAPDRAVSIVTVMEVLQGVRSKAEMRTTKQFFLQLNFRILPLSESIGHIAASLIEEHALSCGLRIQDALIAATAREAGETLATGNVRHFRVIANLDVKPFRRRSI